MGGLPEERSKKGGGGRTVAGKGNTKSNESSRTAEGRMIRTRVSQCFSIT